MSKHDIVVIGASAGGLEAIRELVSALPKKMAASVFIVVHTGRESPGLLATIVGRWSRMPTYYPAENSPVRPGHIYVAPADHHMLLDDHRVRIVRGPMENRSRPAIDPLFRSAAWNFGPRVIGIILSGLLDDGVAGLWAIKESGGITIVQDPGEAMFSDMPMNALRYVHIDHILPVKQMARRLPELIAQPARKKRKSHSSDKFKLESEFAMAKRSIKDMNRLGKPSAFACPTCHGTMWELRNGEMVRYRCHVGHAFSPKNLLAEQSDAVEEALYEALKAMEEKSVVLRRLASQFAAHSPSEKSSYESRAAKQDKNAKVIRELIAKRGA